MLVIKDKRKFRRGITIITTVILLLIILIFRLIYKVQNKKDENINIENEEQNTVQAISNQEITNNNEIYNEDLINSWELKLVNASNSVSKDYVPELEEYDDGMKFDKRAMPYLKDLMDDIQTKGKITKIWIASSYRSYEKQEQLFNDKVKQYKEKGKSQEEAERLAQTIVQRPEMSEHNLALAVDLNTVTNEFEDTAAFEWLSKNAQNYGFILRYPKDKQEITGITYESWHWRYVGIKNAKIMKEKDMCLEEYIEYLKNTKEV